MLILLWVDDCLADGCPEDVEWFFHLLGQEFQCTDTEYLTPDSPQDYLGMGLYIDTDYLYVSMGKYIEI